MRVQYHDSIRYKSSHDQIRNILGKSKSESMFKQNKGRNCDMTHLHCDMTLLHDAVRGAIIIQLSNY